MLRIVVLIKNKFMDFLKQLGAAFRNKILKKPKLWLFFRIGCVILLPLAITFYMSTILNFSFRFQPLYNDQVFVSLLEKANYDILNEVFKFDISTYRTSLFNNVKVTIGGDKKDYEHEAEIFIKDNKLQENELKIGYGESKIILDRKGRDETIKKITNIIYRANVNLKPELLLDNEIITMNKRVEGYIEITVKLTTFSWFVLYVLSLLATPTLIKLAKEICQFICCGKRYFKCSE